MSAACQYRRSRRYGGISGRHFWASCAGYAVLRIRYAKEDNALPTDGNPQYTPYFNNRVLRRFPAGSEETKLLAELFRIAPAETGYRRPMRHMISRAKTSGLLRGLPSKARSK
jgi:hypothetical protein